MGVTPSTVSRWETGTEPMGMTADRLLRLMVTHGQPVSAYPLSELQEVRDVEAGPIPARLTLGPGRDGWHAQA